MIVLTASTPVTVAREKVIDENLESNLARVLCICYPIHFRKKSVSILFDWGNEFNAIHLTFAKELGLPIRPTDIKVQKIDSTTLDTYGIVVAAFLMKNKANRVRFFEKFFLGANVSPEVVFGMPFFTLSRGNIDFMG